MNSTQAKKTCYFVLMILVLNSLLLPTTMFWCFDGSLHFFHQLAICFLAWIPHMSWFKRCQHHRFREKMGSAHLSAFWASATAFRACAFSLANFLRYSWDPWDDGKRQKKMGGSKNVQNPHQISRKDGFQLAMLHVFLLSKCKCSGKWVWKDAMNIELIIGVPTEIHWFGSPHWILGHVPHRKFETLIIVLQRGKVGRVSSPKIHCIRCPSKIIHWKKNIQRKTCIEKYRETSSHKQKSPGWLSVPTVNCSQFSGPPRMFSSWDDAWLRNCDSFLWPWKIWGCWEGCSNGQNTWWIHGESARLRGTLG